MRDVSEIWLRCGEMQMACGWHLADILLTYSCGKYLNKMTQLVEEMLKIILQPNVSKTGLMIGYMTEF